MLSLEAAAAGAAITKLAVNEPPYLTDATGGETARASAEELRAALEPRRPERRAAAPEVLAPMIIEFFQ